KTVDPGSLVPRYRFGLYGHRPLPCSDLFPPPRGEAGPLTSSLVRSLRDRPCSLARSRPTSRTRSAVRNFACASRYSGLRYLDIFDVPIVSQSYWSIRPYFSAVARMDALTVGACIL